MAKKVIEKPIACGVCPFYSENSYRVHNERGEEANCGLGFMKGYDMRDQSFYHKLFDGCKVKEIVIELL